MKAEEFAELKRRMVAATDYSEFHHYYVAKFFEREEFRKMGQRLSVPQTQAIVQVCLELYLGGPPKDVMAIQANLTEIPEYRLVYGVISLGGKVSSVLYFDDLDQGMLTVIEDMETLDTEFIQFHVQRPRSEKPN